jgi:hypothetical protein
MASFVYSDALMLILCLNYMLSPPDIRLVCKYKLCRSIGNQFTLQKVIESDQNYPNYLNLQCQRFIGLSQASGCRF